MGLITTRLLNLFLVSVSYSWYLTCFSPFAFHLVSYQFSFTLLPFRFFLCCPCSHFILTISSVYVFLFLYDLSSILLFACLPGYFFLFISFFLFSFFFLFPLLPHTQLFIASISILVVSQAANFLNTLESLTSLETT